MPNTTQILAALTKKAEAISAAIDRKQSTTDRNLARAEKQLFDLLVSELFRHLKFDTEGRLINSVENLALMVMVDKIFDKFRKVLLSGVVPNFVSDMVDVVGMTGELYTGEATAALLSKISADNTLLLAKIGVTPSGKIIQGSILWEVSQSAPVRQGVKNVILSGINAGLTLAELTANLKAFVQGTKYITGRLRSFWRTYAYDVFNQAAEVKNEQFRRGLDLQWFLYVGDIIKDSREFCVKKAGQVFAVIEADTEWPSDPDLVGKKSGIPYTPRVDRGRWNCRHRIRYITEELAQQLDPGKVADIKKKYGTSGI